MAKVSMVAAMASNRALGKDNKLLWHISEDLKHFNAITSGGVVVMGRRTWESLGRLLPGRTNVIVTRNVADAVDGAVMVSSLEEAVERYADRDEIFIIGGGQIYSAGMSLSDRIYLTEVMHPYEADTFFPEIDTAIWHERERQHHDSGADFAYPFDFVVYDRAAR